MGDAAATDQSGSARVDPTCAPTWGKGTEEKSGKRRKVRQVVRGKRAWNGETALGALQQACF